jgi:KGK domain
MTNNLTPYDCGDDDVIAFGEAMFRAGKLKKAIDQSFDGSVGRAIDQKLRQNGLEIPSRIIGSSRLANEHCQWFEEGINCEILDLATRRWRKGKVRVQVSVEFMLEDPGEKMLLPGDREPTSDRVDVSGTARLSPQNELNGDEFTGEYVFSSIHHNDR